MSSQNSKKNNLLTEGEVYKSFWLRWHLFQLLLPLVGLRSNNWRLEAIEGFEFTYADVLANQQFMAFCTKHAQAFRNAGDSIQHIDGKWQITLTPERS
ncbi:hypothetical protein PN36_34730, partial [Candidatus Thiomargarita nelsonii]